MFKYGDDVRQDMFFLQMLNLIDNRLRKENLDLRLTPYRVLAVSRRHGMKRFRYRPSRVPCTCTVRY
jgi:phosphatidylinositol 3-kinase